MSESCDFRLFLVRHGETDVNREQRMQGITDAPLNENGRRQLARVAERLAKEGIDAIYSSDLPRALESAEIVSARIGAPVVPEPDLREQDLGDWEGIRWPDLAEASSREELRRFLGDLDFGPPGGETKRSLLDRVVGFVDALPDRHPGGCVLVVTHGGPLMVFVYHALGIPFGPENRFYGANAGITEFGRRDGIWRLHAFNETHFLRP
ncbi:MAG: histidine phosphatase family protein [Planctomycetota bacterium]